MIPKAFEVSEKVMARRNVVFDENDRKILTKVFDLSKDFRR